MKILKILYITLVTMLFFSCNAGKEELFEIDQSDGELIDVKFSLSAPVMRAQDAPTGLVVDQSEVLGKDNELINSYFIIFVHDAGSTAGHIASIVSRNPSLTQAVQWEQIQTRIPEGYYTIYAFANISQNELETAIGHKFTEGVQMPDISNATWSFMPTRDKAKLVPMANKMSVHFTSHYNPAFAIEVVRMVGKVQFFFRNQTVSPLSVIDYRITPLCRDGYLFGRMDGAIPQIPASAKKDVAFEANLTHEERLNLPLGEGAYHTKDAFRFYTSESHVTSDVHPTEHYIMTFMLKRQFEEGEEVEEQRYAMTPNQFSYIRRNQYIIQPITFTDWVLEPEARFYPPIGGYPTVEMESEKSYKECYVRFISPNDGVFVINPRLHNLSDPDTWVYLTDTRHVEDYTIEVEDNDGIFKEKPAFKGSEIMGTFNGKKGTAKVIFKVTIKISGSITRLYQRELFIINK